MAKLMTRRQTRAWLAPMRAALSQLKTGEVDAIQGYAVTRLHDRDDWARLDYCIRGFVGLLERLAPDINMAPASRLANRLAAGVPLTVAEIDAAFALLNQCEARLIGLPVAQVQDAVMVEQINIELEAKGLKGHAAGAGTASA